MNDRKQKIIDASRRDAKNPWWWPLWRVVRVLLVVYLAILLLAMLFEERLIFQPLNFAEDNWQPVGLDVEDVYLSAADGTKLHGWYVPHDEPMAHILFLHGNAGNLTHRADVLRDLQQLGASVFILDYRGYGKSEGSPNEQGVLQDARAARTWFAERSGIAENDIVLLGRSLGGGVAVDLTTDVIPRALILESTFTSLPDVAAHVYPFLPVRWAMSTRFDSQTKIVEYTGPLLQSHGTADAIIPFEFGKRLHDACPSPNKQFMTIQGGGHNDYQPAEYFSALRKFLAQLP